MEPLVPCECGRAPATAHFVEKSAWKKTDGNHFRNGAATPIDDLALLEGDDSADFSFSWA